MQIEAAQRVREGLAELIRFVNDADTSTAAARRVLEDSKAFGAQVAVLQADAAALVAKRDRHGDGGVGVLAQAAGLSKRDAVSQVKTVEILQSMPSARDALASGEISVANARTLATGAGDSGETANGGNAHANGTGAEMSRICGDGDLSGTANSNVDANGDGAGMGGTGVGSGSGRCGCGSQPMADITIVQHLSSDGTNAFAEIGGGGTIPQSVLEEYFCNARITGVVFSGEGVPLWHGHTKRLATKAQMNALRTRYGACGGCGADMWVCQGHHVEAVLRGGPTNIDNMMLVCWACHQKIHHHGWREVPDGRGLYTIVPPERIRYGPAHAPDPPPAHGPPTSRSNKHPGKRSGARAAPDQPGQAEKPLARAHQPEPLFTLA